MALARGHGLDRPRDRRAARRPRALHPRHDRRRAGRAAGRAAPTSAAGRLWLPFTRDGRRGAAGDPRRPPGPARAALRLAPAGRTSSRRRPRSRSSRATASRASSSTSTGTRRRCPPSSRCPACEAHGRTLPVDPYLLEPLEHYLRTVRRRAGAERARGARPAAPRARRRDRRRPPLARRPTRRRWRPRRAWAASCGRSSAPASPTCCTRGARSSPTSRASARPSQALAALEADDAYPGRDRLPRGPEAQLAARDRALAAAPLACTVIYGTGVAPMEADITVLNYEIVHAHRVRLAAAPAEGAGARRVPLRQEPARQAHPGGAAAGRGAARRARCGWR